MSDAEKFVGGIGHADGISGGGASGIEHVGLEDPGMAIGDATGGFAIHAYLLQVVIVERMSVHLIELEWPEFGTTRTFPRPTAEEFARRVEALREAAARRGYTHAVIYADREHFGNLAWLTGFDPRFEEAVLIVRADAGKPLLLTGIECTSYLPVSPLWLEGGLRHEQFDDFSLPDLTRGEYRSLEAILGDEGVTKNSRIGLIGWKTYAKPVQSDAPSYLVDVLRGMASEVTNATGLLIDPHAGLRTFSTATDIAFCEASNVVASEGLRSMIAKLPEAVRGGWTDFELAAHAGYQGLPQGCHWTLKTGKNRTSLSSANGSIVERGQPLSTNICYWGSNCCRAGWVAESAADLPAEARDYVEAYVGPYFAAMAGWFERLRIGTPGGELESWITSQLPKEVFGIKFNAGHLIQLEEWMCSPVYPGSTVPLHSGMIFQSDVIPGSKTYFSTRLEDTFALADAALWAEIRREYPDCASRIEARRAFMADTLGLRMSEEVLPLANLSGWLAPFLLAPHRVMAIRG